MTGAQSRFISTLPIDRITNGFDPAAWRAEFDRSGAQLWEQSPAGALTYASPDGQKFWLTYEYAPNQVSFGYKKTGRGGVDLSPPLISVGDAAQLGKFDLVESGATIPSGSFVPLEMASKVVLDFLVQPQEPSKRIEWVDIGSLPWPDDDSY